MKDWFLSKKRAVQIGIVAFVIIILLAIFARDSEAEEWYPAVVACKDLEGMKAAVGADSFQAGQVMAHAQLVSGTCVKFQQIYMLKSEKLVDYVTDAEGRTYAIHLAEKTKEYTGDERWYFFTPAVGVSRM